VLWRDGDEAAIAGRLVKGEWQYDHDIRPEVLASLVIPGDPFTAAADSGAFVGGPRWDCDRFVVSVPESSEAGPILAGVGSRHAFPRPLGAHTLSVDEQKRVAEAITAAGGNGAAEIRSAVKVDIDGDGAHAIVASVLEETVLTRMFEEGEAARNGDYAGLVVLPSDGQGAFIGEVHSEENSLLYVDDVQLNAVADLDGDGRLELFVRHANPNWGSRVDLYAWSGGAPKRLGTVVHAGETDCSDAPRDDWGGSD
jgi:hypothetical protein